MICVDTGFGFAVRSGSAGVCGSPTLVVVVLTGPDTV